MMGEHRGTENLIGDATEIETVYFRPSWYSEQVVTQSVCVAALKDRMVSFVMLKMFDTNHSEFCQLWFTEDEINILIDGLQTAKKNWDDGKVLLE
jgi:hypothetical protein